jgi:hypothetical protein
MPQEVRDMILRSLVRIGFAATLFEVGIPQIARADMLVVESNVDRIQVGEHRRDDWDPDLPPGGRVRVLLSSDESKTFTGAPLPRAIDPPGGTRGRRP